MTVARLREEMSAGEWLEWSAFYARKAQRIELEIERAKGRS
jgi:hypothetical protein